eukprot:3670314-Lingulodinium_polyedra.AAC.1
MLPHPCLGEKRIIAVYKRYTFGGALHTLAYLRPHGRIDAPPACWRNRFSGAMQNQTVLTTVALARP